jgi:PAS domain S-box-containing protein
MSSQPNSISREFIRILHLEDSVEDAEIIADKLSDEGLSCRITRVESRKSFIDAIDHKEGGGWDVILADYSLPSFDGIAALGIAHEKCPEVPFIIISGVLGEEVAVEALKSGATDYILKDRLARLPLALRRALQERTASQERKQSEALLNLRTKALESAANGIVITDGEGTIIWANAACAALTGYSPSEILGQNPRLFKSGRHDEAFYRDLWSAIRQGRVWHGEIINRRKDGSLYTEEMTITPVRDAQGEITSFVAVKRDVTARKELEEQSAEAKRMEAIGRLAGGVAHDFNNMLTVIQGYCCMLMDSSGLSAAVCAKEIKQAADHASELTRQLLMFSRKQVLRSRVLYLNEVVSNIVGMSRHLIGENVELVLASGDALASVNADPVQVEQVIMNLVVNARDAMPQGGRLTIETTNVSFKESVQKDRCQIAPGSYVMLTISDNGQGMTEEDRAHIFEPFFTTKDKSKGRGLGLATVYGVVKQSGGYITVESAPGKGSTFNIYFPQVAGKPEAVKRQTSKQAGSKQTAVVMLVEDEPALLSLARSVLESAGYTVLDYGDPTEALHKFTQSSPSSRDAIDLLLTDVLMPQMSGIALAERMLRVHPKMKVLYMSGYSDEILQQQGMEASAALIPKPFTPAGLLDRVRAVLESLTVPQKRQHHRADCPNVEVECEWGEHRTKARGVNVSEGGILVTHSGEPIPVDKRISLHLQATAPELSCRLRGSVVRVPASDRVAVKFEDLSIAERDGLRRLVASQSGSDRAGIARV